MTSQVVIKHKGFEVGVGSGFTIEQRREFTKNPSKIVGKTVTIQYFSESFTDNKISLRFPVLKYIHGDLREV